MRQPIVARTLTWLAAGILALVFPAWGLGAQSARDVPQGTRSANVDVALQRPVTLSLDRVPLAEALEAISEQADVSLSYSRRIVPVDRRVSIRAERMSARDALEHVLRGTDIELFVSISGQVALARRAARPGAAEPAVAGTITGRVTERPTGVPIDGAVVVLEGTSLVTLTGNTGRYRLENVPVGTYTIVVQHLGHVETRATVTVADGAETAAAFAIEVAAVAMDELVVTGTAFETRRRTVPNPINVITSREIEEKHATNITDLLRGEIPGVMPLSFGSQDYQSFIYVRGNSAWTGGGDYIKIYIDGVAIARPWALSTIDPNSIDRIEVVRGPQASAIYGSEAASGVLQIFTKKGGSHGLDRPRLDGRASLAVLEGDYTPEGARPVSQDYSLEMSGGSEAFSYRVGGSHSRGGEWIKGYTSEALNFSGGLRAVHGPFTAELTALWSDRDQSPGSNPIFWRYDPDSCPPAIPCGRPDYTTKTLHDLSQNTMGLSLTYVATPRWQHTLTLGDDQNRFGYRKPEPALLTPADTFVTLSMSEERRRSISYKTAYSASMGSSVTGRVTAGVDYWSFDVQGGGASNLLSALPLQTSTETTSSVQNDQWSNTGYFGMLELGLREQLYLTLATRIEDNPRLGEEYGRAVSPRVGASYVRNVGPAEVKLRAQYGKGIRPPPAIARTGRTTAALITVPNPKIGPEEKIGWDAGVELYWGRMASLAITRYDEEGRNLIQRVSLDETSVPRVEQYLNVGRVASKGWEAEATVNAGPMSLKANYAYTDNVIESLSNTYVEGPNQVYQVGDRMLYTPRHSAGATLTGRFLRGTASVNMSVMHERRALDYVSYYDYQFAGAPYRGSLRDYYVEYSDAPKWNVNLEQGVTDRLAAFLRVENLTNNQNTDISSFYVAPGRSTTFGMTFTY